jgi:hypothetical protein
VEIVDNLILKLGNFSLGLKGVEIRNERGVIAIDLWHRVNLV